MKKDRTPDIIEFYKTRALKAENKLSTIKAVIEINISCTLEELLNDEGILTEKGEVLKAILQIIERK